MLSGEVAHCRQQKQAGAHGLKGEAIEDVHLDSAARLAAERGTVADRAAIAELLAELGSVQVTEQRELMKLDREIHRTIYRSARNSFLESTLERYFNLSLRLWFLVLDQGVRLREAVTEHRAILEAVMAGDGDRADEAMRRHVAGFESAIRRVLVER